MHSFYNPLFLGKIIRSYLLDVNRLWRLDEAELQRYRNKKIRQLVQRAYTVPLYHDKYKKKGIHPADIKSIQDVSKLPEISKNDIKKYRPDGIIPQGVNKNNLFEVSTSGTTGKSLAIFVDWYDIIMGLLGYLRALKEYDINWRKTKMTIIGDFAPHTAETGYIRRGVLSRQPFTSFFDNIQWLDTNDEPEKIIEKINRFDPSFIGGYVGMLGHLAVLKEKGYGNNVNPEYIATTGSVLAPCLKEYIEKTFSAHVFEVYGATESGPIAMECREGNFHIMSDLVHAEFMNQGNPVSHGEPGSIVITKLYGGGTPIVRYNAVNDMVSPQYDEKCSCSLSGDLIGSIYGRSDLSLYLPDGTVMLPSAFAQIFSKLLYELKTNKVKDLKVVQHSLNSIEISLVIDDKLLDQPPSVKKIFSVLKQGFQEKAGPDVDITINQVNKVSRKEPRIISKVDKNEVDIVRYV